MNATAVVPPPKDGTEHVLNYLLSARAVRSIRLAVIDQAATRCHIVFMRKDGEAGHVVTRRGQPKVYRLSTAVALLNSLGVTACSVDRKQAGMDVSTTHEQFELDLGKPA